MTPNIRLSSKAEAKLATIPLSLLDELERKLGDLAESPASLSQTTAFPFPAGKLMHHFLIRDFEDTHWDFTVLFQRLPDEEGIFINNLAIISQTTEEREGPSAP
jgi:hypothetical protein